MDNKHIMELLKRVYELDITCNDYVRTRHNEYLKNYGIEPVINIEYKSIDYIRPIIKNYLNMAVENKNIDLIKMIFDEYKKYIDTNHFLWWCKENNIDVVDCGIL